MLRPLRWLTRLLDLANIRPVGLIVFVASILGLLALQGPAGGRVSVRAVTTAPPIAHAARFDATVTQVHARPGEHVAQGAPLLTLSPLLIERQLRALDAEILLLRQQHLLNTTQLAQERLLRTDTLSLNIAEARRDLALAQAEQRGEQRWRNGLDDLLKEVQGLVARGLTRVEERRRVQLDVARASATQRRAGLRVLASQAWLDSLDQRATAVPLVDPLTSPTEAAFQAQLALLNERRTHLTRDLEDRVITASAAGRVVQILPAGSPVSPGLVVAQLLPEQATEIIAYLPHDTRHDLISPGADVAISSPKGLCDTHGTLLRIGAQVEQAPGQLDSVVLRRPTFGLPVYASIPEGCALSVGQSLTVEISP